jgi:hypothetical protein
LVLAISCGWFVFLLFFHGVHGVLWVVGLFIITGEGLVIRFRVYCDVPGCVISPNFGRFFMGW